MRDDFYASFFGAGYSAYMERPRLSSVISRLVWGGDTKPYYASMAAAAEVPDGGTIVDCPCGAGPALRAIPTTGAVDYIGVDLSPSMIRRARERATARGLSNTRFVEANATDLPSARLVPTSFSASGDCTASPTLRPRWPRPRACSSQAAAWSAPPLYAAETPCASAS